jgi:hypothetical protein
MDERPIENWRAACWTVTHSQVVTTMGGGAFMGDMDLSPEN